MADERGPLTGALLAEVSSIAAAGSSSVGNITDVTATYGAWITVSVSATDAVTECGVITVELFQGERCSAVAATVAYIDAATSDHVIVLSVVRAWTTFCMKTTTMESETQFKELKIPITGAVSCTSALSNS